MLRTRVITGLVLGVAVTATILLLSTVQAALLLGLLWLVGAWEWGGLVRFGPTGRLVYTTVFLVVMLATLAWGVGPTLATVIFCVAVAGWLVAFAGVLTFPRPISGVAVAVAGFPALLPAWAALLVIHGSRPDGPALTLACLAIVWGADVGAYFVGRRFGRNKLAPKVSPGKTWEGVGGGVALAMGVAALAGLWLDAQLAVMVPAAAGVALVSVVGDLTVSMLKRRAGLKDTSGLLPGHGGVMDRIDGVTAALPVFALALQFAHVLD